MAIDRWTLNWVKSTWCRVYWWMWRPWPDPWLTDEPTVYLIWHTRMHACTDGWRHKMRQRTATVTARPLFCMLSTGCNMLAAGVDSLHTHTHTVTYLLDRSLIFVQHLYCGLSCSTCGAQIYFKHTVAAQRPRGQSAGMSNLFYVNERKNLCSW